MVGIRQNPSKRPIAAVPDDEEDRTERPTVAQEPTTLVITSEPDEDDGNDDREGLSIRERLQKTPTRERFHELA